MSKRMVGVCIALWILLCGGVAAADWGLVEDDMTFMREEEKLARDVYATLYDHFTSQGMALTLLENIAVSEQRHMDAMKKLLDKYGIPDSAVGNGQGDYPLSCRDLGCRFNDEELAALYVRLIEDGKSSPFAALLVGALIEEVDMSDLARAIADADGFADVQGVYETLLCGSGNHLRAFAWNIELTGISYVDATAEYLAGIRPAEDDPDYQTYMDTLDAVLTADMAVCGLKTGQGPTGGAPGRQYRGGR